MHTHKVAVIGADGIGPEVIEAGCRVLDALAGEDGGFGFAYERFDWGSDYYRRHGRMMPEDGLVKLEPFDAIYFGAVDRKSTRLNSSHANISYAVFCLKKKKYTKEQISRMS